MGATEGHMYVDGTEGTQEVGYNGGADNAGNTVRIGFSESAHSATNFVVSHIQPDVGRRRSCADNG
ncbi:hypothetical protein ACFL6S_26630 [Candidatus Poribacteria bacterium]